MSDASLTPDLSFKTYIIQSFLKRVITIDIAEPVMPNPLRRTFFRLKFSAGYCDR